MLDWKDVDSKWLDRCAIWVLKKFSSVSKVNERLIDRGYCFTSRYMGGKAILWCFESVEDGEGFINKSFFWNDTFASMDFWSKPIESQGSPVWVKFAGVPLYLWNETFFKK